MNDQRPVDILHALAKGFDPLTAELLPADGFWHAQEVVNALRAGAAAVEECAARQMRQPAAAKVGQPWSPHEEHELLTAFAAGVPLAEIATRHERSLTAIEARLERLGKLAPEQRVTKNRYAPRAEGEAIEPPR